MVQLTRAVRFSVERESGPDGPNGFGGRPPMHGVGAHFELRVTCGGEPNPVTGYLVDIGDIDRAVRTIALAPIRSALFGDTGRSPAATLFEIASALVAPLRPATISRVQWMLTPTYSLEMEQDAMDSDAPTVRIRQQFDFAAAHRLHIAAYSDEENRRLFGKCNNPSGHGHNYRVEAAVDTTLKGDVQGFTLADLEDAVERSIIARFDHTHLNLDTDEFRGRNPSVEHTAQACFERLHDAIDPARALLHSVTVWETDKTSATYPAV